MIPIARWRLIVLGILGAAPLVVLLTLGLAWLWQLPWEVRLAIYLGLLAFWSATAILAWRWQIGGNLLPKPKPPDQFAYTDRDQEAWKLVLARVEKASQEDPQKFVSLETYLDTGREMAQELARFYHPGARDPVGRLTVLEVLAVIQLAAEDLWELLDKHLPGSHLLTIDQWRALPKAADWYRTVMPVVWAGAAIFDPLGTLIRYTASRVGIGSFVDRLQKNVVLWFYTNFLLRMGHYLIEVNSGRLKVGAKRYRELVAATRRQMAGDFRPADTEAAAPPPPKPIPIQIVVLGRVKAGKSSLINALLGEQRAATDVLPLTREIMRYFLKPKGLEDSLTILDTVGYGNEGPRQDQLEETLKAAKDSDILLLVLNARDPGRQADVKLLEAIENYFRSHPELRRPCIFAVLTHIDLLPPSLEWQPPYDFQKPTRPKEKNVAEACQVVKESLGNRLPVIPVCTQSGKVYGVEESLLPLIVSVLDESRGIALLRMIKNETDARSLERLWNQLLNAGSQILDALFPDKSSPAVPRRPGQLYASHSTSDQRDA
ncbi:MAG: GTPase domain-containing protein [Gemmatales bacterium]|nr:GTPase domain-containing protein [Gemmatales bacterium]MDW8387592.1 GTPase domain-containing protein [Gemmatales bacterium]